MHSVNNTELSYRLAKKKLAAYDVSLLDVVENWIPESLTFKGV